jgi:MYXO-CTERM domain-containing protein
LDFTAYANGTFTAHVPEPTAAAGALALAALAARRTRRRRPI